MKHLTKLAAGLAVTLITGTAQAGDQAPVVVELFTSQGCYSCPPAEAYLGELAGQDGVVALEWHVDYWDSLVYGFHGKWKDPFSSPANTRRQQLYNVAIRKRSGVYTPQMVIDGHTEEAGTRPGIIRGYIERFKKAPKLSVTFESNAGLNATIQGDAKANAGIFLVRFVEEAVTRVKSGENHDKTLKSHNIVREIRKLGDWQGTKTSFALPKDATGGTDVTGNKMGCAILVQAENQGPILGAGLCPKSATSS